MVEKNEEKIFIPFQHSADDLFLKPEDLKFHNKGEFTFEKEKKSINRNYDFLFSEEESIRIDELKEKYHSQTGIKSLTTYLRLKFIEKVREFCIEERIIWEDIHYLTSNKYNERHGAILEFLSNFNIVKDIKANNKVICIRTNFGEIKFSKIGDFFPDMFIDDDIEDIEKRTGKCHAQAINYSEKLKSIGVENDVVTAYRYGDTNRSKYLHSWNEFQIDGKEHVLDYTQNIVMNKAGYYSLNHINEIISRINSTDIENDKKIYRQISGRDYDIDAKTYLTCRDEIMRDLQRNSNLFDIGR